MSSIFDTMKNGSNQVTETGVKTVENITDATSNAVKNGLSTITDSTEKVKNMAAEYLGNSSALFYGLIALIFISFIIGYGLYVIITDNVIYQQKITIDGTTVPLICNEMSEHSITQHLDDSNGKRRTYSFWIYINDINKYSDFYRHIAHIGDSHKSIRHSSPYIVLDKKTNKIHVRFAVTDDILSDNKKLNDYTDINELLNYNGKKCGFTIEYVPIQRWVHIAFSISDRGLTNGGAIYIYVDGELIDIKENNQYFNINVAELKLSHKGTLYIGGNINDYTNNVTGFSGLLSKFTIYNYDLNQNDVYKEYNKGPFSGLLTQLGLGSYGLRNPIYKINSGS